MTKDLGIGVLHELVQGACAAAATPAPHNEQLLLADFLSCVSGGAAGQVTSWRKDGTAGVAAILSARSHARDQDDLHWGGGVHPGSVIWPVVLAVGAETSAPGELISSSARCGYQAMVVMAGLLGPHHAAQFHATATCGALGAALTAAQLLQLSTQQTDWACAHAIAVAGGVGQAVLERSMTTRFHRVAAAVTGIQAARLAQTGVSSSEQVLEGPRGVLALLAPHAGSRYDGHALADTSVRLFPVNGFAQTAVCVAAQLRKEAAGEALVLLVEVPEAVAAATTGVPGGPWWDLRAAVAAAWSTGDPFRLEPTIGSQRLRDQVRVTACSMPPGATRITVQTADGSLSKDMKQPPGYSLDEPSIGSSLQRKWEMLVGQESSQQMTDLASVSLARGFRAVDVAALLERPQVRHGGKEPSVPNA